jgi:hypothetical protein
MKKFISVVISALLLLVINAGCSQKQLGSFQVNDQEPQYNLLKLFDGFPALHSAIDTLDSQKLNDSLGDMLVNGYETPQFLRDAADLVQAPFLVPMIGELHGLLDIMMDTADYHYKDSGKADKGFYDGTDGSIDRLGQFYSALDQVVDNTELSRDVLAMAGRVVDYMINEKDPADIEEDMGNMMKVRVYQHCMYDASGYAVDLPAGDYNLPAAGIASADVSSLKIPIGMKVTLYDGSGNSVELTSNDRCLTDNLVGATANNWNDRTTRIKIDYDISKLAKLLGKVTMSCDYPIWVNSGNAPPANRDLVLTGDYTRNTDLGNAVEGLVMLLYGLNQVAATDETARDTIDAMMETDLPALLNSSGSYDAVKTAIINLEDYFAPVEFSTNTYNTSSDYHNSSNPYVNASLKEALRDMMPTLAKLFIRDDDSSTNDDAVRIFHDPANKRSPIEALGDTLYQLKEIGIDYSQSENALEPSLKRMVDYNAFGQERSSASYKVSMFDHLLYTIAAGYNFGFLTRVTSGASGEPYNNQPSSGINTSYQHGAATRGIITMNDSMYSLTTGGLNVRATAIGCVTAMNEWTDSYNLALSVRSTQGPYVWRSNSFFTHNAANKADYQFYMGYDYPTLLLLPKSCAGDAGLPNGGQKAITPTSNGTTVSTPSSVSQNDYRTYFPKVDDGVGELNTDSWMFGWIARACWDGAGPYYYADPSAGTQTINGHTGTAYYKPNGEIYALVDKSQSPWVYYYPATGNDVVDSDPSADGQRSNRYKDICRSDYYMVQKGHTHSDYWVLIYHLGANPTAYCVPPMHPGGDSYADAGGRGKYYLTSSGNFDAQYFQIYEKVQEWTQDDVSVGDGEYRTIGNAHRECASQEEAMFRNYQWLMLEKKFMFVIPMNLFATLNSLGYDVYVDSAAYIIIEANGMIGLANAKAGPSNGVWNLRNSEGTGSHASYPADHRNSPDYGDSMRPGDSRIIVFANYFTQSMTGVTLTNGTLTPDVLYGLLGDGHVLPDIVGANIAPVGRLGFVDQASYQASNFPGNFTTTGAPWTTRNKLLPIFIALAGTLKDGTYYDQGTSGGYNYNYSGNHKYPLDNLMEGLMIPLSKPMMRYWTDNQAFGGGTSAGRWVPRMQDEDINLSSGGTYDDRFSFFMPNVYTDDRNPDYRPRSALRTVMSVLADGSTSDGLSDGILPLLSTRTQMVSRILALLQQFGDPAHDAHRPYVFKGLEQLVTAMKVRKSEIIGTAGRTTLSFPEWMFNTSMRDEDIDMEDLLGYEGPFKTGTSYEAHDAQWDDFQDTYNMLASFVGGSRDITPNLVNIVNAVLAQSLTEEQVHGLLYTAGKIFARHDSTGWHYQGYDHGAGNPDTYDQLIDMLAYLPQVHDIMKTPGGTGEKYVRLLKNVDILLRDNESLLNYAVSTMTTPYSMEYIVEDLDRFLGWSIISDPNSPLWDDLVLMLEAMADMNDPRIDISTIIKNLGFQSN